MPYFVRWAVAYNDSKFSHQPPLPMLIKIIVVAMLLAIVGSLFSALLFMYRGQPSDRRTAKALTLRVVLSIALFVFLMIAFYTGLLPGPR